jgi:integrase
MKLTAPNIAHAHRVARQIRKALDLDVFAIADYFPDSPRAAGRSRDKMTFGDACTLWLDTKGQLSTNTKNQYRNALKVWKLLLDADKSIAHMTHGYVAAKVGKHRWSGPKLLNNYLICQRGLFALAGHDLKLEESTVDGIENSAHQAPAPDPLTLQESKRIIDDMRIRQDERVLAYLVFAFATGCRPEEIIALRWSDIDWNHMTTLV